MHESLTPEIKFFLDNQTVVDNKILLKGWVAHLKDETKNLKFLYVSKENDTLLSKEILYNDFHERKDVKEVYSDLPSSKVGFETEIPYTDDANKIDGANRIWITLNEMPVAEILVEKNANVDLSKSETLGRIGNTSPEFLVVDNFYENPNEVREYALSLEFEYNIAYHKGKRTKERVWFPGVKEFFEKVLDKKITSWDNQPANGVFQYCIAEDPLVIHTDSQKYAAAIYLTPNAPAESGTNFYRHKKVNIGKAPTQEDCILHDKSKEELYWDMFQGNFYDFTPWEKIDTVANVYNRMAIWNAQLVHAAGQYFGDTKENGRLFHLYFFDAE
jgi:hypothetical protein